MPTKGKEYQKMANNLCYQFKQAIEASLALGSDKHSIKKQQIENDYRIYSYASRKEYIDFAYRFVGFLKEYYPDIKQVKQIRVEHVNAYLQSKSNLTQKSMQHEVSCINKMELCCKRKYTIKIDWRTGRKVPVQKVERLRKTTFTDKQIKGIEKFLESKRDCAGKDGYYLAKAFSLRASEVVNLQYRDICLDKGKYGVLHIHESKGKRNRDIQLTKDEREFLVKFLERKGYGEKSALGKERIVPLRSDSLCCYLNRICKQLGYSNIVESKTSYHALRKYTITQYYKEQRKLYGDKKAREMSMERLGHSKNRKDLFNTYILL